MVKTFKALFDERIGKTNNVEVVKCVKRDNDERFIEIEDVHKRNDYHDALGRFTFAPTRAAHGSGGGGTISTQSTETPSVSSVASGNGSSGVKNPISNPTELRKYEDLQTEAEKKSEIARAIDFVERTSSTEQPKPFKDKPFDIESVKKECKCTDEEALEGQVYAKEVLKSAVQSEPAITSAVINAAKENGGTMYGLDFRLKGETSLTRKIINDKNDPKETHLKTLQDSADNIKDAVRYTMVFNGDSFTEGYTSAKASLEKQGFTEVRCKNYWQKYADGTEQIKSVQCVFQAPDGHLFELQFQTPQSQGAKELCHPMYEKAREAGVSKPKKKELERKMTELYTHVSDPKGVYNIKQHDETKKE